MPSVVNMPRVLPRILPEQVTVVWAKEPALDRCKMTLEIEGRGSFVRIFKDADLETQRGGDYVALASAQHFWNDAVEAGERGEQEQEIDLLLEALRTLFPQAAELLSDNAWGGE